MIDYRKVLMAYMDVVGEAEGIDFLPCGADGLTNEELIALHEAALERRDISKEHIADLQRFIESLKSS